MNYDQSKFSKKIKRKLEGYRNKPEVGTGVTAWQRAQQMEVAPAG